MIILPKITRHELYEMSTTELYELNDKVENIANQIKGELMARGDY